MIDGVPSEEQRRRIQRRVLDAIDARRRLRRGIAGGAVAAVLLAGGAGLVASVVRAGSGATTAAGESAASGSSASGESGPASGSSASGGSGPASGSGFAGSSGSGSRPASAAGRVTITCALTAGTDAGRRGTVSVPVGALPIAAIRGCGGSTDQASVTDGGLSSGSGSAAASPDAASARPPASLCIDVDGGLVVIPRAGTSEQACTRAGLRLWER